MIEGYKLSDLEKNEITSEKFDGVSFNPVLDINGDWFIFEEEYKACGLGIKANFVRPESPNNLNI